MGQTEKPKKIYLVDRDFQLRYARVGFGVGLISSVVTTFLLLYPLFSFKILFIPNFLPLPIFFLIGFAIFANCFMIAFFAIHVSHRISGPVFSMVRFLRELQDGHFGKEFMTRDGDELKFLSKHLNETSEALVRLTESDLTFVRNLKERIEKISDTKLRGELVELCEAGEKALQSRISVVPEIKIPH